MSNPPINRKTHACPIPGCPYRLPYRQLMCPAHWANVEPSLKRRVWDTWGNGRPRDRQAYLEARQAAINSVSLTRRGVPS